MFLSACPSSPSASASSYPAPADTPSPAPAATQVSNSFKRQSINKSGKNTVRQIYAPFYRISLSLSFCCRRRQPRPCVWSNHFPDSEVGGRKADEDVDVVGVAIERELTDCKFLLWRVWFVLKIKKSSCKILLLRTSTVRSCEWNTSEIFQNYSACLQCFYHAVRKKWRQWALCKT